MVPGQLADVFAYVERTGHRVTVIQVNAMEFEDIVHQRDPLILFQQVEGGEAAYERNGFHGTVWGARVIYRPGMPLGQVVVSGRAPRQDANPRFVEYLLEIEPSVRPVIETVDQNKFESHAEACNQKLKDIRDHVALHGHRGLTVQHSSESIGHHADPERGVRYIDVWRIICVSEMAIPLKGTDPCQRTWTITEDEVAAAGRFDLADRFGWGAEIESAKRTSSRERPLVWQRVGSFLDD